MRHLAHRNGWRAALLAAALGSQACAKGEERDPRVDSGAVLPSSIVGVVQKGPFVRGAVKVQELGDNLEPTGASCETTTDDLGSYDCKIDLRSRFVEVTAVGPYYDELHDEETASALTLRAVSDVLASSRVNVNVLTTIAAPLTRSLVAAGRPFAEARRRSESALLDALGFARAGNTTFDRLDIVGDGTENALLLGGSLLVAAYGASLGTAGGDPLGQFLLDLEADAVALAGADAALADGLRKLRPARCAGGGVSSVAVRANLTARYASFGVTVRPPPFERYLAVPATCADAGPPDADAGPPDADAGPPDADAGPPDAEPDSARCDHRHERRRGRRRRTPSLNDPRPRA